MDNLSKLTKQIRSYLLIGLSLLTLAVVGIWWLTAVQLQLNGWIVAVVMLIIGLSLSMVIGITLAQLVTEPVRLLQQAILHVSPGHSGTVPPNFEKSRLGRELITSLSLQVYQLASSSPLPAAKATVGEQGNLANDTVNHLPVPLFVIDKTQAIRFANEAACTYINQPLAEITGKNVYSVLDLSFANANTLDAWLADCRANKVTATNSWERVRLNRAEQSNPLQFDMAAYYSKDDPSGAETILTLFDHTARYAEDDEAASYVALAVHELRTPLTILRGYIEVFEDELAGKLNPELTDFMNKMQASAEALAAFVNNILNVARVEENQLTLELREEPWDGIIKSVTQDMQLRAQVHGKTIQTEIATGLPTVAVDKVSIYEVLNNLLDNAIKYSGPSKQIIVKSVLTKDGLVETTVQDFGVGIPESVMPNLFDKFYRSHRSRAQIGGTGLGLYLSKAIVAAHGGQIWVRSKEGQGSVFGFTLMPYSQLAEGQKNSDNKEIVRGAHGWIKNHSLYRR